MKTLLRRSSQRPASLKIALISHGIRATPNGAQDADLISIPKTAKKHNRRFARSTEIDFGQ